MRTPVLMRTVVLVGALAIVCPATARAGSIVIENVSEFNGVGTGYWFEGTRFASVLGSVSMSGGFELGEPLDAPSTFEAYCVDIIGPIDFRRSEDDPALIYDAEVDQMINWEAPTGLNTEDAGRRAAWLYNRYADTFGDSQLIERTSLQVAIWEVLYDETPDVLELSPGAGRFSVAKENVTVANQATEYLLTMLANLDAVAVSDATWLRISQNGSQTFQDFVAPSVSSTTPVPEPSAGLLLGMGAMSLAAFRSRKTLFRRS